ncbi:hypothetical protein CDO51_10010 [Natranaerobius trueperi]|uniref:Uncharacterized protein n=1 Tax=Natranaerobius trueperi TaxID=759412 RepID=A0A226BVX9_9FIRM|nr:hypothetical protein CDO51_10010 [Natranaerobius trueperi]
MLSFRKTIKINPLTMRLTVKASPDGFESLIFHLTSKYQASLGFKGPNEPKSIKKNPRGLI